MLDFIFNLKCYVTFSFRGNNFVEILKLTFLFKNHVFLLILNTIGLIYETIIFFLIHMFLILITHKKC